MQPMRSELLQRMPIFGAIRDDALLFLLAQAREVAVGAGAYFFRESDQASSMYVLESGRVTRRDGSSACSCPARSSCLYCGGVGGCGDPIRSHAS